MEKRKVMICGLLSLLGLLSALSAFAAESTNLKRSQIKVTTSDSLTLCTYPRTPAADFGVISIVLLMMAQTIVIVESGWICCGKGPALSRSNLIISLICLVFSWFSFVIAFLVLLTASAINDEHTDSFCYIVKPGVFSTASVLSIVSVALGIVYYLCLNLSKQNVAASMTVNQGGGIAMGQAQIPERVEDPVFVHEDTYMRRQFP